MTNVFMHYWYESNKTSNVSIGKLNNVYKCETVDSISKLYSDK